MARPLLLLADGSSLLYRSYFALLRGGRGGERPPGLTTSQGLPTGAVYGFLTTLRKILKDHAPTYVGIAFDHRVPTVRHDSYAEYKANRKPMPEDLALQVPYVRRAVEALRIPLLMAEKYEADDVLATIAKSGAAAGLDVLIATMDKDMYQLLSPNVSMLQVRTETKVIRGEDVVTEFGVEPSQVAHVLALWGDPSDNIPGVTGIGDKGAKALIAEWKSLDALYQNLDKLKPAQATKLRAGEESARLSLELATLHADLDVPLDLEALKLVAADNKALYALCSELEFRKLAEEFAPVSDAAEEGALYETLTGEAALAALLARARATGRLALDVALGEGPGGRPVPNVGLPRAAPMQDGELAFDDAPEEALEETEAPPVVSPGAPLALVGLGLAAEPGRAAYLPIAGPALPLAPERALALLKPLLEDPAIAKVGPDLKLARTALRARGIELRGLAGDTTILSYLLNPGRLSHDVDAVAMELFRRRSKTLEAVTGKGRGKSALADSPVESLTAYVAERADLSLQIADRLLPEIEAKSLGELYRTIELPLLEVLADMEETGVKVDRELLAAMSAELAGRMTELETRIHALAGHTFNIASPRQLGEVLFDQMQLPVLKKTKKSKTASTDTEVLEELARSYELPRLVLEHRELAKLKGTYVDALPLLVRPTTGRVHTSYNQTVAATGRLSSSDPNLQNIPIRTETGRRIRKAFTAEEGSLLVVADYSQIELRLLAHLSGDPELAAAFAAGTDVHTRTAATMFGVHEALVTPELRRRAKVINFGIVYGMSPFGLSRELGVTPGEAAKLIEQYFSLYAGVRAWLDRTIAETRERGFARTLLGRIRYIPEITAANRTVREYAERTAVNTPIQGTAADLIKLAMVRIHAQLREANLPAALILQVHDELVLEVEEAAASRAREILLAGMTGDLPLTVPLVVTMGQGRNWIEAK